MLDSLPARGAQQRGPALAADSKLRDFTSAICRHGSRSLWQLALLTWTHIADRKLEPNTIACNAAIAACRQGSSWHASMLLFQGACALGLQVDTIGLNTCLAALGKRVARWITSLSLLKVACRKKLQPDSYSCTALCSACQGRWWLVRELLDSACRQRAIQPSMELFNAFLSAGWSSTWPAALCVSQGFEMRPDRVTFKILSRTFGRSGAWQACTTLLGDATNAGVATFVPFASLAAACGRQILWRKTLTLGKGWHDPATATAVVSTCARARVWERSVGFGFASDGLQVDTALLNSMLSAWSESSVWSRMLTAFKSAGPAPDMITATAAMDGMIAAEKWRQVCAVLEDLRVAKLRPDAAACSTILRGLKHSWSLALVAMREMGRGMKLDLGNFASVLSLRLGWQKGLHVLRGLPGRNVGLGLAGRVSTSALTLFASQFQELEGAQKWAQAVSLLAFLGQSSCSALLGSCLVCLRGCGRREQALSSLQTLGERSVEKDATLLGVVLSLCDREDLWQDALHVFRTWPRSENSVPAGALIASCGKAWQWTHCVDLLQMARDDISVVSTNSVMESFSKMQRWMAASNLLAEMTWQAVLPDLSTLNSAVSSCRSEAGSNAVWAEASALVSRMSRLRLQADLVSFAEVAAVLEQNCPEQLIRWMGDLDCMSPGPQSESPSQAVAALEVFFAHGKVEAQHKSLFARRILAAALPRLSMTNSEAQLRPLQLYSLGPLTSDVLRHFCLHNTLSSWLPGFRAEARRKVKTLEGTARSARLIGASQAHVLSHCSQALHVVGNFADKVGEDTGPLIPVFVDHDRSSHAERQALLSILAGLSVKRAPAS